MLQLMAVFAEWSSRITSERIKAAQAILRQQRRPMGGKRQFGYHVAGKKGQRHLVPDCEERAILVRIIKAVQIEGIVAWDKLSVLAQNAAATVYAAKPDAVRRTWSESTVRRAVDGFWRLVHAEGTDWIDDPAVKGLAMTKTAATVSQASKRPA
jgi:DNA invertase Pin-like site-specific DNA recombinase